MQCPHCQGSTFHRIGLTTTGSQRYRCKSCGKNYPGKDKGRPRKPAGICHHCQSADTKKIGSRSGKLRIFCNGCRKTSTIY